MTDAIAGRRLGRTGFVLSPVGFGARAIGGFWGPVDDAESMRALHAAVDAGVTFIDTADVYGDGRSERLVEGYSAANLQRWVDDSLARLGVDALDLLQLHCPPPGVYGRADVFGALDALACAGKVRFYGVSVETVDEALAAMQHPHVQSIQITFNMFRPKPAERVFAEAARARERGGDAPAAAPARVDGRRRRRLRSHHPPAGPCRLVI